MQTPVPKTIQKSDTKTSKVISQMLEAGIHFGHKKSKWHPKMRPFIYGARNNVYIIDLYQTYEKLNEALKFLKKVTSQGKTILFVGTKISAQDLVQKVAQACEMPYVNRRWIGGILTNFEVISQRLNYFRDLLERQAKGEFEKYSKKERHRLQQEIQALTKKWEGLRNLTKLPDTLFVIDIHEDTLAVDEARRRGIPVVAICDTNTDPSLVDYPIPANDDALSSLQFILENVQKALLSGKKKAKETPRVQTKTNSNVTSRKITP